MGKLNKSVKDLILDDAKAALNHHYRELFMKIALKTMPNQPLTYERLRAAITKELG